MTTEEKRATVARYWLTKSREALASARDEAKAGRLSFAVNRCYYAAFYAASAVLLLRGYRFKKHSGVRASVHQHLVKPGLLAEQWGRFYDRLFEDRQEGDYLEFVEFEATEIQETLAKTADLVSALEGLKGGGEPA